ncbi:MAG: hypothetical protein IPK76_03205 [Lewinellaceae bacterium]|nr:hypothetical protein [Lewinellaceae bacterium]
MRYIEEVSHCAFAELVASSSETGFCAQTVVDTNRQAPANVMLETIDCKQFEKGKKMRLMQNELVLSMDIANSNFFDSIFSISPNNSSAPRVQRIPGEKHRAELSRSMEIYNPEYWNVIDIIDQDGRTRTKI